MADTTTNEAKISIKVFVDKVKKRVVYAEADHSFVDILFSLMTLPLGTIVKMLGKHADTKFEALGSLNNLYQSLKDIPESYFATEECKFMLLNPRSLSYDHCKNLKLKIDRTKPVKYFICESCRSKGYRTSCYYSICNKAICKICGGLMNTPHSFDSSICVGDGGVFVSDIGNFIVTDDFYVMPYSVAGIFRLLTDLGINDTSHLEEIKLDMDSEQMVFLLKIALSLDSPFTRLIFHRNNPIRTGLVVYGHGSTSDRSAFIKKEKSTCSNIVLEISLQKLTGKLLFAEAKEDFAEFLFGLLSIPLGTVVGTLMNGASSISCMDNIFKSISNMSVGRYLKSQDIKDMLLEPHFGQEYSSKNKLFPIKGTRTLLEVSMPNTSAANQKSQVLKDMLLKKRCTASYQLKDPRLNKQLLLQSSMFFVTNDLVISPSSSQLAMNTLNKLKVKLDDIEKYEISIGLEEVSNSKIKFFGLRLLKAALRSRSTLTSILEHHLKK
ncbi:hypothetical protein HanRHA438_Chr09g0377771 [Helianthus annuus]|uniref:DUF674 family protein n=2 Tax=Helianthus annuus TaxID=4232 RepID=A0A9K3N7C6_HELAN|nr:hypothetical protein HanXRQr2_Chr09g0366671 [Helianthus annuus]KAJ0540831.1 hypothetical protein HanHA89_Chr09g0321291 [Helianthus annuus]KAJ0705919.1 hypothetical protein HanLR1_Chr09g0300911 [Helianthus annuus]KAJ0886304.1 hypothetical protein HanRHA438_Chr09g0377771 [Helianthus annuus]